MKNLFKKILICMGVFSFLSLNVYAEEVSFINENGVIVNKDLVKRFEQYFDQEYFNIINQEKYDNLYFIYSNGYSEESIIYAQRDLIENGKIIESTSTVLTEEEYERQSSIELYDNCTDPQSQACHQTSYKRLTLLLSVDRSSNYFSAFVANRWLKDPKMKSADVIALRYNNSVSINKFYGEQWCTISGSSKIYSYSSSNGNSKKFSNGVGISMNLADAGSGFSNYLFFNGYYSNINTTIYASYQHAQSAVTVADSKVYNLSANGLGGVINFTNATTRSKYDAMLGISYSLSNV